MSDSHRIYSAAAASAVIVVAFASYLGALSGGFVTDDFGLLVSNPTVKSWGGLTRVFTTGYWDAAGCTRGLYRPLAILSFLFEYQAAGVRPFLYHLDNVLLHALCSLLAYLILVRLLNDKFAALFAAAVFAVHPVHTEAVCWISGRAELLAAAFGLSSVYLRMRRPESRWGLIASVALYVLAILSKESAAVVPLILAIYFALFVPSMDWKRQLRGLVPYLAALGMFLALKLKVVGSFGPQGWDQALGDMDAYHRALTMGVALFNYITLGFLPLHLRLDYFFPAPASIADPRILTAIAAIALLLAFMYKNGRNASPALFGAAWFFAALLPVSNVLPTGIVMSERAMYVPVLGICVLIGWTLTKAKDKRAPAAIMSVVVLLLAAGTVHRSGVWRSQETYIREYVRMLDEDITKYPDYAPLYMQAARIRFRYCGVGPDTQRALSEAQIRVGPNFELHAMRAGLYSQCGQPDMALGEIRRAIALYPQSFYYNFESIMLLELGRAEEARAAADEAIRLNPRECKFHVNMGNVLLEAGDYTGALAEFKLAAEIDPDDAEAAVGMGVSLSAGGELDAAAGALAAAVKRWPDNPDARIFFAAACLDGGMRADGPVELESLLRKGLNEPEAQELMREYGAAPGRLLPGFYIRKTNHPHGIGRP